MNLDKPGYPRVAELPDRDTRETDNGLRRVFRRNEPTFDERGFLLALEAKTGASRGPQATRSPRLFRGIAVAGAAVVLLAAVSVGAYELAHHLAEPRNRLHLTDAPSAVEETTTPVTFADSPAPDFASLIPAGYVFDRAVTVPIPGQSTVEHVIVSHAIHGNGPVDDVQIASWDSSTSSWVVTMDLQKQPLDPSGNDTAAIMPPGSHLVSLDVVQFSGRPAPAVVVAANVPGADGRTVLAVADYFQYGWYIAYSFSTGGTLTAEIEGAAPDQALRVGAGFYGPDDPHAAPARTYHFVVGGNEAGIAVIEDDRPWLGVVGYPYDLATSDYRPEGEWNLPFSGGMLFYVSWAATDSPADGILLRGDLITGVASSDAASGSDADRSADITYRLEQFFAGDRVTLTVRRAGQVLTIPMVLGSVLDPSAREWKATSWYVGGIVD
jgi:hypothetical protein